MLNYKPFIYYAKNDSSQEAIDKVLAPDYLNALWYFSNRKQMSEVDFLELYIITEYDRPK